MNINFKKISPKTPFLKKHQREILIGFCALIALLVSLFFPVRLTGESFWAVFFLFFVFPSLIIFFLLKEPAESFGISWGNFRIGVILSVAGVAIFIFVHYLIIMKPEFRNQLIIPRGIASNFWYFLFFEVFIALPLHFFWEFFFRGFIQLGLEKKLGIYSLFLQAVLQSLLAFRGTMVMIFLTLLSSLFAGAVVRQSRSIFYSSASMWLISVSLDIMIIRFIQQSLI